MGYCTKCGEAADNAADFCWNCGAPNDSQPGEVAEAEKPPEKTAFPVGLILIIIFCFFGVAGGLMGMVQAKPEYSYVMGIKVPVFVSILILALSTLIILGCAIGFIKRMELARKVYIGYGIYAIIASIFNSVAMFSVISSGGMKELEEARKTLGDQVDTIMLAAMIVGLIIGLAIQGAILTYLFVKKKNFIN